MSVERARVQDWLTKQQTALPATPFGQASAALLLVRWDTIQRLRFTEDASGMPTVPAAAILPRT